MRCEHHDGRGRTAIPLQWLAQFQRLQAKGDLVVAQSAAVERERENRALNEMMCAINARLDHADTVDERISVMHDVTRALR